MTSQNDVVKPRVQLVYCPVSDGRDFRWKLLNEDCTNSVGDPYILQCARWDIDFQKNYSLDEARRIMGNLGRELVIDKKDLKRNDVISTLSLPQ